MMLDLRSRVAAFRAPRPRFSPPSLRATWGSILLCALAVAAPAGAITLGPEIGPCTGTGCPVTYPPVGPCGSIVGRDESYSVVVGGSYTVTQGAEAEGKLYIGGTFAQNTGAGFNAVQVGVGACVTPINSNAPGGSPHLLIGGNVALTTGSQLLVGQPSLVSDVRIGGSQTGPGSIVTSGTVQTGATLPASPADFSNLDTLADFWATLTPNGTIATRAAARSISTATERPRCKCSTGPPGSTPALAPASVSIRFRRRQRSSSSLRSPAW